jgi:hypothetical protein
MQLSANNTINKQSGGVSLATALILLLCTSLVVIYAAKQAVLEQAIAGNQYRYFSAFAQAEAGLNQALAAYKNNSTDTPCELNNKASWSNQPFCAQISQQTVNGQAIAKINAKASSDDKTANIDLHQSIGFSPWLVNSQPAAALIVAGSVNAETALQIAVNPNGGGIGVPVSIWSRDAINFNSSSNRCQAVDLDNHNCSNPLISDLDLVQNVGANFPDLFAYLFGYASNQANWLKEKAKLISPDQCQTLNQAAGLYWVEGNGSCVIDQAGQSDQLDTNTFDPQLVVLVLNNVPLQLKADSQIVGYVLMFGDQSPQQISVENNASILGGLFSNQDLNIHQGNSLKLVWSDYSSILDHPNSPTNGAIGLLAGGWRDF